MFETIEEIISGLRELSPDKKYESRALADWIEVVTDRIYRGTLEVVEDIPGQIPPFITPPGDGERLHRHLEYATKDLLGSVLVPAGAAIRWDEETFSPIGSVLEDVEVG